MTIERVGLAGDGAISIGLGRSTLIKSKNPWNDRPENASQSKVTLLHQRHLVAAPATRQRSSQAGVALPLSAACRFLRAKPSLAMDTLGLTDPITRGRLG
jgi:hypothetical protein